jgi:hypothetical protein
MVDLSIKIPAIDKEWSVPKNQPSWKDQASQILRTIKTNYLKEFQNASSLVGVPINLLLSFAAVESGGARNEKLDGASKGLMQVNTDTVWQVLSDQLKVSTLGNFYPFYIGCPKIFSLVKPLPKDFWSSANVYIRNEKASDYIKILSINPVVLGEIRKAILSNAQWSIYVGSLTLAQLINGTIEKTGQIRLDHIIIKYNAGIGRFRSLVTRKGLESASVDTTAIYNAVPIPVTRAYIVKLLGINGFLDLLKRNVA